MEKSKKIYRRVVGGEKKSKEEIVISAFFAPQRCKDLYVSTFANRKITLFYSLIWTTVAGGKPLKQVEEALLYAPMFSE